MRKPAPTPEAPPEPVAAVADPADPAMAAPPVGVLTVLKEFKLSAETAVHAASMGRNILHEIAQAKEHITEGVNILWRIKIDAAYAGMSDEVATVDDLIARLK